MEEIKMNVRNKQLDGSTEVSEVTFTDENEVEAENSVEPNPNAGYTKAESDERYQAKIDTSIFLGSITKTGTQDLNIQDGQLVILESARTGGISIGSVFFQ